MPHQVDARELVGADATGQSDLLAKRRKAHESKVAERAFAAGLE